MTQERATNPKQTLARAPVDHRAGHGCHPRSLGLEALGLKDDDS
jgi:hypothetical protein